MKSRAKENSKKGRATNSAWNRVVVKERRKGRETVKKEETELREQKIKRIKKQIEKETYHVEAAKVAKAIVRNETARLLGSKHR